MTIQGIISVEDWEETFIYHQSISKVSARYRIEGQMSGVLHAEYTIFYKTYNPLEKQQSESIYNGYLIFNGMIGQSMGGFVMEECGYYNEHGFKAQLTIVDGTGTGAFNKVNGKGYYEVSQESLEFNLEVNHI